MREKIEVGGVGDFDACNSSAEVLDKWIDGVGGPAEAERELEEMLEMVRERRADAALPVMPVASRFERTRTDEVRAAMAILKPGKRF